MSVQGSLAMSAIHKYGSEEQKQRWLPGMAAGELIGCFALTEPQGGSDPAAMTTTARRDGDGWVLDGAKRWIGLASLADVAVVWARVDDPSAEDGRARGARLPRAHLDAGLHRDADRRQALDARVGAVRHRPSTACGSTPTRCCPARRGLSGPFGCLNEARYGIVWGAMGAARRASRPRSSVRSTREVFGKPIGANQLIQAKLADMFVEVEKGVLLALHLGRLKERGALTPAQISRRQAQQRARGARRSRTRRGRSSRATASPTRGPSCGTPRTSSRCAPTRAPTRSTSSCSAAPSPG